MHNGINIHTPTKYSDAQPLGECEKQMSKEEKKTNRECHAIAYGFLCLRYKYEVRKYSHYVIFTFM